MNYQRILVWSLIVLGLFAVVLAIVGVATRSANNVSGELAVPINDSDWYLGAKNAKVILVEYSDFQCPACAYYSPIVNQLAKDFGDKIKIVYRHFPLPQHQYARLTARYAEAAGKQNKFWQMTEIIFDGQSQWEKAPADKVEAEYFLKYAQALGLNMDKLKADLNLKESDDKIESDLKSGEASNITYTPTFFLNSKQIQNPQSYEEFKALIQKELGR